MEPRNQFYSGTSGLVLPVPNKLFYPEPYRDKSRLTYYGSLFNSIEINSSFYKVPRPSTVINWASGVPDHFKFTFKLYRQITHQKQLHFDQFELSKFMKTISHVGAKKGCLLIQLPPGTKINCREQLIKLFTSIHELNTEYSWNLAIEFRDRSWYTEDVVELMEAFKVSLVIHDMPKSATPTLHTIRDLLYIRFHGPAGDYRGSYSNEFLRSFANKIYQWLTEGKKVFLYFNNTIGGAIKDLAEINRMVEEKCL